MSQNPNDAELKWIEKIAKDASDISYNVSELKVVVSSIVVRVQHLEDAKNTATAHRWNWWNIAISLSTLIAVGTASYAAMVLHHWA